MNKTEFIKALAEKASMTQKDAGVALEAVLETVKEALAQGERVQLIGFGSFEVRYRKERKVVAPGTKKEIVVPATKVPAFRPGKSLKEAVDPDKAKKTKAGKAPRKTKKK